MSLHVQVACSGQVLSTANVCFSGVIGGAAGILLSREFWLMLNNENSTLLYTTVKREGNLDSKRVEAIDMFFLLSSVFTCQMPCSFRL